jgi:hypothetical protein
MFKSNSGRKQESNIWKYFKYDASSNKSICIVQTKKDNDIGDTATCGQQLIGKIASNLKYHMRSQHKTEFAEFENSERQRKQPQDKGHTTQQTKLAVHVEQVCEIEQPAVVYHNFFQYCEFCNATWVSYSYHARCVAYAFVSNDVTVRL